MNIWTVLATNSTFFNPFFDSMSYAYFDKAQEENPTLFKKSLKFWHARYGPRLPKEMVFDYNFYGKNTARDFMKDMVTLYPQNIYVRDGMQYIDIDLKAAFCFTKIRKKLVKAWDITEMGPKIDPNESEGTLINPLDLSEYGFKLSDFKLISMLLNDDQDDDVLNLTCEQVQRMDDIANQLKLDTYKWLYIGRSRYKDQTGTQIECTYHGKDVKVNPGEFKDNRNNSTTYDFVMNFKTLNWKPDTEGWVESLEVTLPKQCQYLTSFKFEQNNPGKKSYLMKILKTHESYGCIWSYSYHH